MTRGGWVVAGVVLICSVLSGCTWTQWRDDSGHTGAQSFETAINAANVGNLVKAWTAPVGGTGRASSASIANGTAYLTSADGKLDVFDAGGTTNCSGALKVCTPLWTAAPDPAINHQPAVAGGLVFTGLPVPPLFNGSALAAYDAAGSANCGGNPRSCTPLWRTDEIACCEIAAPNIVGNTVYTAFSDGLVAAFDRAGVTNCSGAPKLCEPLWWGPANGDIRNSSPAVANGVLYIGTQGLQAFDANGVQSCAPSSQFPGSKECQPLWTGVIAAGVESTPAVANGVVSIMGLDGKLDAFDAAGQTNCVAAWKLCAPLWSAAAPAGSEPAVSTGVVYVGTTNALLAFDAAGTSHCSGSPKTCTPLWSAPLAGAIAAPTVANGLVYVGSSNGLVAAFDAGGTNGCGGAPKTCLPLWSAATGASAGSPVVAGGVVYVPAGPSLQAYALP